MNYTDKQFICLPHITALDKLKIKYTDIAVYVAIRSYNNPQGRCYPSYDGIAKKANCSKAYVSQAIKRLEQSGLIKVERSKKIKQPNRYSFQDHYMFEQIPYHIFNVDLKLYDLSMLLCMRQFCYRGRFQSFEGVRYLSEKLGVSYKVAHQRVSSLIKKGYVTSDTGSRGCKYKLTDKVNWIYDYHNKYKKEANVYPPLIIM